jgi:hypothetical protein
MRRFRFARSLIVEAPGGEVCAWVAESFAQRLLGLAGLPGIPAGRGLLIPRCAAVHTWGMRFALDIAVLGWPLGSGGDILRWWDAVEPGRCLRSGYPARSAAVLEAPAGELAWLGGIAGPGRPGVTFRPWPLTTRSTSGR